MVNFNNSIMIRNHAGSSVVKDTAKLIETLKKVGIIKTKKRRARRSLAKDEIRQDSDMGPGYAISMPPQFGASPQQQDYNAQRIEDIQRQSSNQIAFLRSQLRQIQEQDTNRFGLQQRIENGPKITQPDSLVIDTNEFEGSNSGPQPDTGSGAKMDFDEETATGIFVGDEPVAAAELTDETKIQKVIEAFNHSPIPNTVKALKEYIKAVAEEDGVMLGTSGTKEELLNRIKSYYLSKYRGFPY